MVTNNACPAIPLHTPELQWTLTIVLVINNKQPLTPVFALLTYEDDEYRHTCDFTPGHNQSRYHEIDDDHRGGAREASNPPPLDRQHTSHNGDGHCLPDHYNAGPARSHHALEDPCNLAKRSYNEEDVGHPVMGTSYPEPPPKKHKISQLDDSAICKVAPLPARQIPSGGHPTSPNNGRPGSSKDLSRGYPPDGRH
ncbi:uncharacterized protein LACBIDRAFT_324773 [Laccaria bicolor S238N-H82]|uniref:Predicted protein n=1 Tax=Laccaria bicolor (strain S238N-H82 / ATCC MYA-4686) TaxID=486041 RepID=B0D301_LACBS|nr:uncharacterized protein LACBIDRAFT_324773 [Laccaria bicolor S238N-H82]EDR11187.1 predicted protein [Laccaria bicolor S238N-H82]|eukprot:XP_001878488.1 predicted protein [Laccaria bicolor S238N-H82]